MGTLRKCTFNCAKQIAKEKQQQRTNLENQLKIHEKYLDKDHNLSRYNAIKNELHAIYGHITDGIRIRSKCEWYEYNK